MLKGVSRLVMFNANDPDAAQDDFNQEHYDYFEFIDRKFGLDGLPFISTQTFADFDRLITTGFFDVGMISFPEYLSSREWERLYELVPNMGAVVKGFVLATHKERDAFPKENERYGNVIRVFKPLEPEVDDIFDFLIARLRAVDKRPNTNFIPPRETEAVTFTASFDDWPTETATACEQYLLWQ